MPYGQTGSRDLAVLDEGGWTFHDKRKAVLLEKIKCRGTSLEEIVMDPVHEGISAARDSLFIIDAATRGRLV